MDRRLPSVLLVALAMAGYVTASRALGEQYPFGPLSMFSGGLRDSSRIVARAVDGRLCELPSFERWHCEGGIDLATAVDPKCHGSARHAEMDRKAERFIVANAGAKEDGAPVEVVRRIFSIAQKGGPVVVEDCVLASCTAREVVGSCSSTR